MFKIIIGILFSFLLFLSNKNLNLVFGNILATNGKLAEILGHMLFGAYCFWLVGENITLLFIVFFLSEFFQKLFGRTFDFKDIFYDFSGAIIAIQLKELIK